MTLDDEINAVADYLAWVEGLPFGAPNDVHTYREWLEFREWRAEREL